MKILIDADGCPVTKFVVEIAKKRNIRVIIICDTSHWFDYDNATTIIVSKGADSADFVLVNKVNKGDIVITQDYGLATMCLAREAVVINQNGFVYTNENIDNLLFTRHISKKIRNAGGKTSHIKKRTNEDNEKFIACFNEILDRLRY